MEDEDKILEIKSRDVELKELSRISWSAENKSTVGVSLPFSKSLSYPSLLFQLLNANFQSYLRGVQWSPNGHHLLTNVNGQGLKLIDCPVDLQIKPDGNYSLSACHNNPLTIPLFQSPSTDHWTSWTFAQRSRRVGQCTTTPG